MKSKIMRGGEEIVNIYKLLLYIFFAIVFIILIVLIYIFYIKKSDDIVIPTSEPTYMPTPEPTKFNLDNNSEEVVILRGQLENWGDDFNSLPDDVKEQAMYCLKNPDSCAF